MSYNPIILFFLSVYSTSAYMLSQNIPYVTHRTGSVPSSLASTEAPYPISLMEPLYYKNDEPQDYVQTNTINVRRSLSPDIYLPRHSDAQAKEARIAMYNAELMLGRVAMLASLVLFGVEITTGTSLPDQLAHLIP